MCVLLVLIQTLIWRKIRLPPVWPYSVSARREQWELEWQLKRAGSVKAFLSVRAREETLKAVWNWFEPFVRSGLTPQLWSLQQAVGRERRSSTGHFHYLGGVSKRNHSCLHRSHFSWCGRWILNMQSTPAPPTDSTVRVTGEICTQYTLLLACTMTAWPRLILLQIPHCLMEPRIAYYHHFESRLPISV